LVSIRIENFNDDVWGYVGFYAERMKLRRKKALELIVIEHARMLKKLEDVGATESPQEEWLRELVKNRVMYLANYFLDVCKKVKEEVG